MINPNISAITNADFSLFQDFFVRDNRFACYGNSWAYITQACRGLGLGWKYHQRDVLWSIGQHRGHYVIARPLGQLDGRFIDLLETLRQKSGKPVFIKKLFSDQVARLQQLGNFTPAATFCPQENRAEPGPYVWDPMAFADDDTYPELIINVDISRNYTQKPTQWGEAFKMAQLSPNGTDRALRIQRRYKQLKRCARQFARSQLNLHLVPYNAHLADDVQHFLHQYFGQTRAANVAAYKNMLSLPLLDKAGNHFLSMVGYVNNRVVGFALAERLDDQSAGYYAGIVARWHSGLPEYFLVQWFNKLYQLGITYLNAGGAETATLQHYKRKQAPVEERYMPLLVYGTK